MLVIVTVIRKAAVMSLYSVIALDHELHALRTLCKKLQCNTTYVVAICPLYMYSYAKNAFGFWVAT